MLPELPPKRVGDSAIDYWPHQIFPNDLNNLNFLYGASPIYHADRLAAIVAQRHTEQICITRWHSDASFKHRTKQGDILVLKAAVNRTWHYSLEIGVRILAENYVKKTSFHVASYYFVFFAVTHDPEGKEKFLPVPEVIPETPEEKRRYDAAEIRRRSMRKSSI